MPDQYVVEDGKPFRILSDGTRVALHPDTVAQAPHLFDPSKAPRRSKRRRAGSNPPIDGDSSPNPA